MTFAEQVIRFNRELDFSGILPDGIGIMNPFRDSPHIWPVITQFYNKFYSDNRQRKMILGINPGRFGAGVTGVPFTDTKRMLSRCGIKIDGMETHEPSSVFVYDVIDAYGGTEIFYADYYINSICPLGFVKNTSGGKSVNYNYYDSRELTHAVYGFIVDSIRKQIAFGIDTSICYCMGTGKNAAFLNELNSREKFFDEVVALEHPRFVIQYRLKQKDTYVEKYIAQLKRK